jgi:hypothetical protein
VTSVLGVLVISFDLDPEQDGGGEGFMRAVEVVRPEIESLPGIVRPTMEAAVGDAAQTVLDTIRSLD